MKNLFLNSMKFVAVSLFLVFVLSLVIFFFVPNPETTVPLHVFSMSAAIGEISGLLMFMRILMYSVVWFYWSPILEYFYEGKAPKAMAYMKTRRNFYLFIFIAIEVILVENILSTLWT